jgi:PhnB protein
MAIRPYVAYRGNCREAFTHYHEVLGGEVVILALSDMPSDADEMPPGMSPDAVMHAALMLPDGGLLMGADDMSGEYEGLVHGVCINVELPDRAEVERVFAALVEGGEVHQPVTETFFSPAFAMGRDRFGVPWMVMVDSPMPG